jgi:thiol-disulfide isomerase/thioredoxin
MKPQNQPPKSSWTLTRLGLLGAAIIVAATIAYTYYQERKSQSTVVESTADRAATQPSIQVSTPSNGPMISRPAAPAQTATLPDQVMKANISFLDGKKKKLADYSGKVLVVDLWATWCGPCRQEIPHLVQIAKEYKSKGVEVIGLTNEDPQRETQLVKDFSKAFNINYPIGWADMPMQIGLMRGRNGIPQTLIIGRDGKVRNHFIGFSAPISVPQMKAALEAAVSAG